MINSYISVLPIFLLILTGYILKKRFIKDMIFWENIEKLVYYILLPILLILSIEKANFESIELVNFTLVLIIPTLILSLVLVIYQRYNNLENGSFTSVFQGSIRYNSYILLSMLLILLPDNGMLYFGIIAIFMIIITNLLSILVLSIYIKEHETISWKLTLKKIAYNPLIIASFIGVCLNLLSIEIPQIVSSYLSYLSSPALTLSLLAVGAGLSFKEVYADKLLLILPSVLKLLILPMLSFILFQYISLDVSSQTAILIYSSVPCAGNAYILSKQMNGNYTLMASIITLTMLLSIFTMPLVLYIFG
ncbi:MAG: AEC family transporter [Arcobacteraceae bacterium]|nr:AEC family transporter [Arcobacteraceae bacterium]